MDNLIIRRSKEIDLKLIRNCEGVYFILHEGKMVDNNLNYDLISNRFNYLEKENA